MRSKPVFERGLWLILLLSFFTVLSTPAQAVQPAPDFKLPGVDGKPIELKHYRGKLVVLNFWVTWCPPCRKEIPDLADFYTRYGDKAVVLGVAMDDPDEVKEFVRIFDVNYPVVIGDNNVANQYGRVRVLPTTFFIDRKGQIVGQQAGIVTPAQLEQFVRKGTAATR